ncbi:MAG TPA: RHS repeat-associated core domain-containing protein, partial [Tepidisphaeraceae bacterium]
YDTSDRLIKVRRGANTIFTASYDARTRRLSKIEGGTTTLFRYDGGTNFEELDGSAQVMKQLVRAGGLGGGIGSILYTDETMAQHPHPVEFYAYDAVGNTVATMTSPDEIAQETVYEAFGNVIHQTGTSTNNRLHNTKERDASIGLDNAGFRYYDPETATFIQRDPTGYADGMNVYMRVHDDPMNGVDPEGLAMEPSVDFGAWARGIKQGLTFIAGTAVDSVNAGVIVCTRGEYRLYTNRDAPTSSYFKTLEVAGPATNVAPAGAQLEAWKHTANVGTALIPFARGVRTPLRNVSTAGGTNEKLPAAPAQGESVAGGSVAVPELGVRPYEVDSYQNLSDRALPKDGLVHDHIPSNASNLLRAEQELGRSLTPAERALVEREGTAVAVPEQLHRSASPTYGGRNTVSRITEDAANPPLLWTAMQMP